MAVRKYRDLTLTDLPGGTLVTACDSCGAVGQKPGDLLSVDPLWCGRFTARVPLLEVLSFGAEIVSVTDTLCCELEPTGRAILQGVHQELTAAGVEGVALNGSTEENFPTTMTALGVTVVGWMPGLLVLPKVQPGDELWCVGLPLVRAEVLAARENQMISYDDVKRLRSAPGIRELVPVGSHGVRWEGEGLAALHGLRLLWEDNPLDPTKSSGPATCLLAAAAPEEASVLEGLGKAVCLGRFQAS